MMHANHFHFYWNGPFSQWAPCTFEMDGVHFTSAEQAMMYAKALLFSDQKTAEKILLAAEPGAQKALGRQVQAFTEAVWDDNKVEIVRRINLCKFGQNKGLRRKLFQTGNSSLVEASPLDLIWGIGLDAETAAAMPSTEWPGRNLLGQVLTDVRETLRADFPDEAEAVQTATT